MRMVNKVLFSIVGLIFFSWVIVSIFSSIDSNSCDSGFNKVKVNGDSDYCVLNDAGEFLFSNLQEDIPSDIFVGDTKNFLEKNFIKEDVDGKEYFTCVNQEKAREKLIAYEKCPSDSFFRTLFSVFIPESGSCIGLEYRTAVICGDKYWIKQSFSFGDGDLFFGPIFLE